MADRPGELTNAKALSSTASFTAVADAYVSAVRPSRNFGTQTRLEVDSSPVVSTYLRFNVQGLTGSVDRATLEVYRIAGRGRRTDGGHDVRTVADTTWDETSITYRNAPSMGTTIGSSDASMASGWTGVDVTPVVRGNGPLALAMVGRSATQLSYRSRETTTAPRLVIRTAAQATTTTATTTTTAVPGPVTTSSSVVGSASPPRYRYMYDHDQSSSGYDRIVGSGFNLVDVGPDASSLDALTPLKVEGLVWLGDYDNSTCSWERSDSTIRSQVAGVNGHPNVAGYSSPTSPARRLPGCSRAAQGPLGPHQVA